MCGNPELRTVTQPPHKRLASLMNRELGTDIDPRLLRLFIKHHWSKVSTLAHQIHDEGEAA
jgi:hypothetical protein